MNGKQEPKRTILGEDGELHEAVDTPQAESQALFCTQCGTANRYNSRFCRQCGASLDDQVVDPLGDHNADYVGVGRRKFKNRLVGQPVREVETTVRATVATVIMEIVTLGAVVGMVSLVAFRPGGTDMVPFILVAWLVVEVVRNRRR